MVSLAGAAQGWDAAGHRMVTYLALDGADVPAWVNEAAFRERIAYQSSEADRWRGWRAVALTHENDPDHYLDADLLEQFGLTLETVPRLRYEYLRALAVSKYVHPERVDAYDASKDASSSKEWPGFLLHAVAEHYHKLQASFLQVRVLERLAEAGRAQQMEQAHANVAYHMGMLSHFVGDMAQPLHTTRHYNGWAGANPDGYTTERTFHAFIDAGVLRLHDLTRENVRPLVTYGRAVNRNDPWNEVLAYFRESHALVEPLYRMERDGELRREPGRDLIAGRIADAASMLAALYGAAYGSAVPNEKQVADFVWYDADKPAPGGAPASHPTASQPAAPETSDRPAGEP
jgi:hypothetical protein